MDVKDGATLPLNGDLWNFDVNNIEIIKIGGAPYHSLGQLSQHTWDGGGEGVFRLLATMALTLIRSLMMMMMMVEAMIVTRILTRWKPSVTQIENRAGC